MFSFICSKNFMIPLWERCFYSFYFTERKLRLGDYITHQVTQVVVKPSFKLKSIWHLKPLIYPLSCSVISDSVTPWIVACQALLCMGFSRQEYWSGLPFPSPGELPDTGIESRSPELQADSLPSEPPGKPQLCHAISQYLVSHTHGKAGWCLVCRFIYSTNAYRSPYTRHLLCAEDTDMHKTTLKTTEHAEFALKKKDNG